MFSSNPSVWRVGRGNNLVVLEAYVLRKEGVDFVFEDVGWQVLPAGFARNANLCSPITETEACQVIIGGKPFFNQLQEKYKEKWNAMQGM